MKKDKDAIEKLFERLDESYDIYEPSTDHKAIFSQKLNHQQGTVSLSPKRISWLKPFSIAASIAIIIGVALATIIIQPSEQGADLASVSPEMEQTQDFFTSAINIQLEELMDFDSEESKEIIKDAMTQLNKLEANYDKLKKDLLTSENDRRVISAMIKNFQKRSTLLEEVLEKINTINELKSRQNENSIL